MRRVPRSVHVNDIRTKHPFFTRLYPTELQLQPLLEREGLAVESKRSEYVRWAAESSRDELIRGALLDPDNNSPPAH
jgi:hypothetical protein